MGNVLTVAKLAGAYVAFLIGSGFATGQEIVQFYAAYGLRGLLGCLIFLAGSIYLALSFCFAGHRHGLRNSDEVFRHYTGPVLGPVFGWYTVAVSYSICIVMLSGAGALLHEHLGIPIAAGAAVMAVAVYATLYFGLRELVDVIGPIGPLLAVLVVVIAATALFADPGRVLTGSAMADSLPTLRAAPNWWLSALTYLSLIQAPMAAFLPPLGAATASRRNLAWAGVLGPLLFTVALAICALALLAWLPEFNGKLIPMLALAQSATPRLAGIYPWLVLAGIFTTAAPLLWISAVRLAPDGSPRYRVIAALLGAIGYVAAVALPFDRLLNLIFPTIGWSGSVLVVLIIVKQIRTRSMS
jgi:uncharacterized membrane protein YkvI